MAYGLTEWQRMGRMIKNASRFFVPKYRNGARYMSIKGQLQQPEHGDIKVICYTRVSLGELEYTKPGRGAYSRMRVK